MSALEIVKHWEVAVNEHQVEQVLALSDPQVELVGPQGSTHGHVELRDWLETAGLEVHTRRSFVSEHHVVNRQTGVWHDEQGRVTARREIATWYVLRNGLVTRVERFNELVQALQAADLHLGNEVTPLSGDTAREV